RYGNAGRIIVFRLDGGPVPLPPEVDWDANLPALPARPQLSVAARKRGEQLFEKHCATWCHQVDDEPGGYPNLLRMHPARHAIFREIVLGGAFESRGMASFADVLSEEDARAILDYLIVTAHEMRARKGQL
ncbi:MAG: c-type cytochrome, partial [Pseudonocardiaceae bacterium]